MRRNNTEDLYVDHTFIGTTTGTNTYIPYGVERSEALHQAGENKDRQQQQQSCRQSFHCWWCHLHPKG